jgi:hypothetical protein
MPKHPKPRNKRPIREAVAHERTAARSARSAGRITEEWHHLERAHILGQPLAAAHLRTHVAMLAYGIRHRDAREIGGQLIRILVAAPGSALGRYPLGNTGGADVSAVKPMPIPAELQEVLDQTYAVTS